MGSRDIIRELNRRKTFHPALARLLLRECVNHELNVNQSNKSAMTFVSPSRHQDTFNIGFDKTDMVFLRLQIYKHSHVLH